MIEQYIETLYFTSVQRFAEQNKTEIAQLRIGSNAAVAIGTICLVAIMVAAIADQEFSWWVFPFGILFGTIFLGILCLCFLNYRDSRFRRASIGDYPDEPWMWDARWRSGTMVSRSRSEFWGILAFAIIVGIFALTGAAALTQGLPEGNYWVLLNLIPIIAAVYLWSKTFSAWRTLRVERHVSLANETCPAWVGARFSAMVKSTGQQGPEQVEAWLEQFEIVRREESDGVSLEKVVDRRLPGHVDGISQGKVRIFVDIPHDSPATSWGEDEQSRWWDLVVSMRISGVAVQLRYEVPVAEPAKHQDPVA